MEDNCTVCQGAPVTYLGMCDLCYLKVTLREHLANTKGLCGVNCFHHDVETYISLVDLQRLTVKLKRLTVRDWKPGVADGEELEG